jgi:hypothetical protein
LHLAKDVRIREASGPVRGDPVTLDQEAPRAHVGVMPFGQSR